MNTFDEFIDIPKTKDQDCPRCGMRNTMVVIPKHRNGVYGRKCGKCGEINYIASMTWNDVSSGNMNFQEFEGMK